MPAGQDREPRLPRVGGRVVELRAPRELAIDERPVPEPLPGEALVRTTAIGICGTDIHGYHGRVDSLPITLGHDGCGAVAAFGPGTAHPDLPVGQRVTLDPTISCGLCRQCRAGRRQLCPGSHYLGMTCPGVLADYISVPVDRLVALPAGISDKSATVLEPVAVALHLLDRIGAYRDVTEVAHVIGGGPLGVLLAQVLQASGWEVAVHEPLPYRRRIAGGLGLAVAGPGDAPAAPAGGPVLVVETSAAASGIGLARQLAGPGSVVALIGRAPADIPSAEILLSELSVVGVRSGAGCYERAITLVASGAVTPEQVVTHEFGADDIASAMTIVTEPAEQVMRSLIWFADAAGPPPGAQAGAEPGPGSHPRLKEAG